jgi:ADP-heptose:LPS heptosyltransferase
MAMTPADSSAAVKEQVLVIHEGDLASAVRMLAAAKMLRERHRKARITLLTDDAHVTLLKHCPYFDAVEAGLGEAARKGFFERIKLARASKFDRVYDLGSGEAGRKLRRTISLSGGKWIDAAPNPKKPGHPLDQQAAALGRAGLGPDQITPGAAAPAEADWIDFLAKRSRQLDPAYFGIHRRYALFAPAGDDVPVKERWPAERWAELARLLLAEDIEPVVVGGPATRETGKAVSRGAEGARDVTGRANLVQLAGLGRQASCVFGEDTGLFHLIVAAGSPGIMLRAGQGLDPDSAPRGVETTLVLHAATLPDIAAEAAVQAMRAAGGFARSFAAA